MDLKEQKYVCTLAECKSLTRASERLYISQPALSLYINNVEKILGARLFERNGRKFELTWLGKQYVEKASQMLELERQFEAVMRRTEQENAGQVRTENVLPVLRSKVVLFHFHFHFLCFLHWCQHGLIVRTAQQAVGRECGVVHLDEVAAVGVEVHIRDQPNGFFTVHDEA